MSEEFKSDRQLAIEEMVSAIENAGMAEVIAGASHRSLDPEDAEMLNDALEDGYLAKVTMVRESRLMGKKAYDLNGMKAVTDVDYEDLFLCEFEDYKFPEL